MTAACFGLGGTPRVGRPYRSADGFDDPITPGGVSARGTRDDLPGAILPAPLRGYRTQKLPASSPSQLAPSRRIATALDEGEPDKSGICV